VRTLYAHDPGGGLAAAAGALSAAVGRRLEGAGIGVEMRVGWQQVRGAAPPEEPGGGGREAPLLPRRATRRRGRQQAGDQEPAEPPDTLEGRALSDAPSGGRPAVALHVLSPADAYPPLVRAVLAAAAAKPTPALKAAKYSSASSSIARAAKYSGDGSGDDSSGVRTDGGSGGSGGDLLRQSVGIEELLERMCDAAGPWVTAAPQLILVFSGGGGGGGALTLAGYPPLHARAAEVYGMGPLAAGCGPEALRAVLARYCRTQQRFGA